MSTVQHNNQFCSAYTCEKIVKDGNDTRARNGYGDYVNYVGNYTPSGSNTYVNLRDSIDDVYSDVYAYMQPGDFLVQNTATRSHVRLVEKVVIKRNSNNSINPYKSYVVISDQGSTIKDCTNNAYTNDDEKYYKTTWHVGYSGGKYTAPSGTKYNNYNFYKLAGKNNDGETRVYYLPYRYNGHTANYVIGFIPGNITESEIELNWNEQNPEYCNGFELVYATDADFSDAQTLIFNNPKKNNCTLRNLEKGKTYYIKMRAYNIHEDGKKEYSGYNNWLRINTNTKDVYRQDAPNPKEVSQKEYKEYVYDDISYEYELDK